MSESFFQFGLMFTSNWQNATRLRLTGFSFLGVHVVDCFSDQSLVGDHGGEQWVYRGCGKLKLAISCQIDEWRGLRPVLEDYELLPTLTAM